MHDEPNTVGTLCEKLGLTAYHLADGARPVTGVYIGDLLSWVMGRAPADSVWITIMSNVNVCAVASLADCACVLLAEGVVPDPEALQAAEAKGINVLGSGKTAYELAVLLTESGIV